MDFSNQTFEVLGKINSVPQNVSYLASGPNKEVGLTDISLLWDQSNQLTRISNFQTEEYYEDYFMTTTWSTTIQQLQAGQVQKIKRIALDRQASSNSLIEIGCGDGSFLQHAKNSFSRTLGIEPSRPFADFARSQGLEILDGYVVSGSLLTDEKFDAFVSRQVFEHLPDPLDCLNGIREMLNPGAIGLIEVPNGYRALQLGRFFEFFPDHVNYYSVNSLVALASAAGFNVISCNEAFNSDYLELWVQLPGDPKSFHAQLLSSRNALVESAREWVESNSGSRFIFGCGAKMLSIISVSPEFFSKSFHFAVDSDPNKIGKFIPNTGIEIVSIHDQRLHSCDSALIMALSYVEEISDLIRKNLPGCSSVNSFDYDGRVVSV